MYFETIFFETWNVNVCVSKALWVFCCCLKIGFIRARLGQKKSALAFLVHAAHHDHSKKQTNEQQKINSNMFYVVGLVLSCSALCDN